MTANNIEKPPKHLNNELIITNSHRIYGLKAVQIIF